MFASSVDIRLPQVPANVGNPAVQRELEVIYNALHNLHAALVPGTVIDGDITDAISAHEAAVDPHTGYLTPAEGNAAYAVIGHLHTGTYDPAGTAATAISTHEGAADPHAQYLLQAETHFPFYNSSSVLDAISLNTDGTFPFFDSTGAIDNIPMVA